MPKGSPDDPIPIHPIFGELLASDEVTEETKEQIRHGLSTIAKRKIAEEMAPKPIVDPFHSSKYCLAWAKRHLRKFERRANVWMKKCSATSSLRSDIDLQTVETVIYFKIIEPMPADLPGTLFDVINSLRAALDQAIFTLTKRDHSYFPISREPDDNRINGCCKGCPPEIIEIVRNTEPNKRGNNLLWALNELSNTNKHAIVIPVGTIPGGVKVLDKIVRDDFIPLTRDGVKDEIEILRLPYPNTLQSTREITITASVVICDIEFINKQPAVTVLHNMTNMVEGIVMTIEAEAIRLGLMANAQNN